MKTRLVTRCIMMTIPIGGGRDEEKDEGKVSERVQSLDLQSGSSNDEMDKSEWVVLCASQLPANAHNGRPWRGKELF